MNIERFLAAQQGTYAEALAEVKAGRKTSHWIWWIFPQLRGLGISETSHYYGISGLEHAGCHEGPFVYDVVLRSDKGGPVHAGFADTF